MDQDISMAGWEGKGRDAVYAVSRRVLTHLSFVRQYEIRKIEFHDEGEEFVRLPCLISPPPQRQHSFVPICSARDRALRPTNYHPVQCIHFHGGQQVQSIAFAGP